VRECPNNQCPSWDIIGSERSCRRGQDPNTCSGTRKWRCGAVVIEREEVVCRRDSWPDEYQPDALAQGMCNGQEGAEGR
jgi:hypothetical protein